MTSGILLSLIREALRVTTTEPSARLLEGRVFRLAVWIHREGPQRRYQVEALP